MANLLHCDFCPAKCCPLEAQEGGWKTLPKDIFEELGADKDKDVCPACLKRLRAALPPSSHQMTADQVQFKSLEQVERDHILNVFTATGNTKSETARILGIERSTLDRRLRKFSAKSSTHE